MSHREVLFLINRAGAIVYADASESPLALPDSRARWEAIWRHREDLAIVVHSHPLGPEAFSDEDLTTLRAVEEALARTLVWLVVAPTGIVRQEAGVTTRDDSAYWWLPLLRLASGMPPGSA